MDQTGECTHLLKAHAHVAYKAKFTQQPDPPDVFGAQAELWVRLDLAGPPHAPDRGDRTQALELGTHVGAFELCPGDHAG